MVPDGFDAAAAMETARRRRALEAMFDGLADGEPIVISRGNDPVAVLMTYDDRMDLERELWRLGGYA